MSCPSLLARGVNGRFPKIMRTFLGVPIIRIMVYWCLYWGPPQHAMTWKMVLYEDEFSTKPEPSRTLSKDEQRIRAAILGFEEFLVELSRFIVDRDWGLGSFSQVELCNANAQQGSWG